MDQPRTIVAVTREDDDGQEVRRAATRRALQAHATLILYDVDAGRDPLESPLPTEWSAEGTDEAVTDRLGPDELEAAGRHAIADQVRAARADGADAWGWLPGRDDAATLASYLETLPDPLVLVPSDEPDLGDPVDVGSLAVGPDRQNDPSA
ncbi:MAG TPA: hypothetical protein VET90_03295 [Candidatus Binatus sp.]|nr:hypothetical protein [Candidatus Binatus sp.]